MKNAPHMAVITISAEIMEQFPDGRVSGLPVHKQSKIIQIKSNNYEECIMKTENFLKGLKND